MTHRGYEIRKADRRWVVHLGGRPAYVKSVAEAKELIDRYITYWEIL